MDQFQQIVGIIGATLGIAWASGINLYAAILTLGILSLTGNITLPESLNIVTSPIVLAAAGVMFTVEFFADKVPGFDSAWDAIQTFIRIPVGAILAAGAVGDLHPAVALAAGVVGGGVAATTHATKAGTRVLINSSPEPFSNWTMSLAEDVLVIAGVWAALSHPFIFLIFFILFVLAVIWLLPRIWRAIKKVITLLLDFFWNSRAKLKQPSSPDTLE